MSDNPPLAVRDRINEVTERMKATTNLTELNVLHVTGVRVAMGATSPPPLIRLVMLQHDHESRRMIWEEKSVDEVVAAVKPLWEQLVGAMHLAMHCRNLTDDQRNILKSETDLVLELQKDSDTMWVGGKDG